MNVWMLKLGIQRSNLVLCCGEFTGGYWVTNEPWGEGSVLKRILEG